MQGSTRHRLGWYDIPALAPASGRRYLLYFSNIGRIFSIIAALGAGWV